MALAPLTTASAPVTTGVDSQSSQSRFLRTVAALQDAAVEARADFATLALSHLALALGYEAEAARAELPSTGRLLGWASAVDRYARDLATLHESIDANGALAFFVTDAGEVALSADGRWVVLGHPRSDQQHTLEQTILREFCALHDCESLIGTRSESSGGSAGSAAIRPTWAFDEDGPVCEYDGISIKFPSSGQLAMQKPLCTSAIRELMTLLGEIRWQMRQAVRIDWKQLAIFETPARPQHRIQLNQAGDSVLIQAPTLAEFPDLLHLASPWLYQRLALNKKNAKLLLDSAALGLNAAPSLE